MSAKEIAAVSASESDTCQWFRVLYVRDTWLTDYRCISEDLLAWPRPSWTA